MTKEEEAKAERARLEKARQAMEKAHTLEDRRGGEFQVVDGIRTRIESSTPEVSTAEDVSVQQAEE